MKFEFSGRKILFELIAIFLIAPFSIALQVVVFDWLNIPDIFPYQLITYAIFWNFIRIWARFYIWIQQTEWEY